jgi:hypothetical protein
MSAGASLIGDPKSASLLHHDAYDKAARAMWYKMRLKDMGVIGVG